MASRRLGEKHLAWLKATLFAAALIPLGKLLVLGFTVGLGANPIEKITRVTGYWTLSFLMLTLTVTPLRLWTGRQWLGRLRRMLGLFAFFYVCLHFLAYLVLDQFFDWAGIVKDIAKRPYITVGFACFLFMTPLAVTSTDAMLRRLGGRRWRALHRLVYPVAMGGVLHFVWLVKKDLTQPLQFAAVLAVLLGARVASAWARRRGALTPS